MSIRLRHHLAILPLFLGLALINGALVYFLDRGEMRWGLQQRAQSTAATLAGFLEHLDQLPAKERQRRLDDFSSRLGGVEAQLLSRGRNGWQAEWLMGRSEQDLAPPGPTQMARLTEGRPAALLIERSSGWSLAPSADAEADRLLGYATLSEDARGPQRVLVTAQHDRQLQQATAALLERLSLLGAALLLVGLVVAELLTRIGKRELATLNRAAAGLAEGHYVGEWPMGHIREVNDLGGTLLTMTSLLNDGSHQTRRRFFEAELLPGEAQLAGCLRSSSEASWMSPRLAEHCVWRRVGRSLPEDFLVSRDLDDGSVLLLGRCRSSALAADELERGLHAETLRHYLLGLAVSQADAESWRCAFELFPCEAVECLSFDRNGQLQGHRRWQPEQSAWLEIPAAERRRVTGTLPAHGLEIAAAYQQQFADRTPEQLAAELSGLLSAHFHGLLLLCSDSLATAEKEGAA